MEKGLTVEFEVKVTECPCGSGKKPAKCCGEVKPRIYSANMDERNYHESDGIAFHPNGSLMRNVGGELLPIIGQINFCQSYKREKYNKVLLSGQANGDFVLNTESVLQEYENIFAIDTNTKTIHGHKISISAVVHAYTEPTEEGFTLNYRAARAFEFWNATVPSERLGQYALVEAILSNETLAGKYTGIIVDSGLDELEPINKCQVALLDDFYLPENFRLIYASSDIGVSGSNKLIKLSDRKANEILEHIKSYNSEDNLVLSTEYPCEYFRQWEFNE